MNNNSKFDTEYDTGMKKMEFLPPIFIVGVPRSGTTLLAVLLDRHSNIAIGPETVFYTKFLPKTWVKRTPETYEELVDSALAFKRIADFNFARDELLHHFKQYELSFANLLRAIIEVYAIRNSKLRPGEKTPVHLWYVPTLLDEFPESKVICILRDGRDVVRSLLEAPWARQGHPRRLRLFCIRWNDAVEKIIHYQKTLPPNRFMLVKFENVLRQPREELEKICAFIGEAFEPTQLEPTQSSSVIPAWEEQWKQKAAKMLDPGRIEAWRRSANQEQIWIMNSMMGDMLERIGYADTKLDGASPAIRAKLFLQRIPYLKRMQKISALTLKGLKKLKLK
jgi:hypothetical protein